MTFLFIRHGQTEANANGLLSGAGCRTRLTALGREQARRAALALAAQPPARVIHSGAPRAVETAAIIVEQLRLPETVVRAEPLLLEYDFGSWDTRPYLPLKEQLAAGETGEGGETPAAFRARIARAAARVAALAAEDGGLLLAVSHGMVWQALHDIHGTADVPWIGNCDIHRVTLMPGAIASESVFLQPVAA